MIIINYSDYFPQDTLNTLSTFVWYQPLCQKYMYSVRQQNGPLLKQVSP